MGAKHIPSPVGWVKRPNGADPTETRCDIRIVFVAHGIRFLTDQDLKDMPFEADAALCERRENLRGRLAGLANVCITIPNMGTSKPGVASACALLWGPRPRSEMTIRTEPRMRVGLRCANPTYAHYNPFWFCSGRIIRDLA